MADLTGALQAAAGTAASAGGAADPNFNQTVLLLHGDGTNGAQNNTFLDSSTNNFTITRNGNTTQGTFSPFSVADGEWSNYFDGTNDYLDTDSTLKDLGTGDFCIQFWIYWNSGSIVVDTRDDNNVGWMISLPNSAPFAMRFYHNAATRVEAPIQANVWTHYAITRSSGTLRIFANGVEEDSATYTADLSDGDDFRIGARSNANSVATTLNGYLSNLSVVIGSAIYTSGFTPSTTPLSPSTTNQKLLTCYSNRFVDANTATTAKTITPTGDVSVQPFSPFSPSAAYSPSVNGGSGYFDGSGDYLTAADDAAFAIGTGDFTSEGWFYTSDTTRTQNAVRQTMCRIGGIRLSLNSSTGALSYVLATGSGFVDGTKIAQQDAWNHFAIVRSGSDLSLFLNGDRANTTTNTTNFTENDCLIGGNTSTTGLWLGYLAGIRFVNGTAVYDPTQTTLTVPTAPPTAITNTEVLCNFTNAGIFDNTGKNNLETVADAQIDTTTKKYGTGSMEFDGTGDYLRLVDSQNFAFRTGNWTVEMWIYPTAVTNNNRFIIDTRSSGGTNGVGLYLTQTNANLTFTDGASSISGGAVSLNAWSHVACVKSGTTVTLYLNGTSTGTPLTSYSVDMTSQRCFVGTGYDLFSTIFFTGFIDDLRITKGVARYTTGFTPPTAALPDL